MHAVFNISGELERKKLAHNQSINIKKTRSMIALPEVESEEEIDKVAMDITINDADGNGGFPLLEVNGETFCCYYKFNKKMTISKRIKEKQWEYVELDQFLLWDSHNYIAMAIDKNGHIHISGNMHASPLVYYVSERPYEINSLKAVHAMTGVDEQRVTYPKFINSHDGGLLFTYRSGTSGNGDLVINALNFKTKKWERLASGTLINGENKRSAYVYGPVIGPDKVVHSCWVWRESPDAETCCRLCYARSKDFFTWESAEEYILDTPITFESNVIVDDIKTNSGIINNNNVIGFDNKCRPLIAYHKYDASGNTQVYLAQEVSRTWTTYQITKWNWRWEIKGRGSLPFNLKIFPPFSIDENYTAIEYFRKDIGYRTLILSSRDLCLLDDIPNSITLPRSILRFSDEVGKLKKNISFSNSPDLRTKSLLYWESVPENRDLPSKGYESVSTSLKYIKIKPCRIESCW